MRQENSCVEMVRRLGVGWLLEQTLTRKGVIFRDALGTRDDGIQDVCVYAPKSGALIQVPSSPETDNIGTGDFVAAMYFSLAAGSDDGSEHVLIHKDRGFRLVERNGVLTFSVFGEDDIVVTSLGSGVNFCNGQAYLVFVYRVYGKDTSVIGMNIYNVYKEEKIIGSDKDLTYQSPICIGARLEGSSANNSLVRGSIVSGFYFARSRVYLEDTTDYWLRGKPIGGVLVFLKLDEGSGNVAYDSSGNGNHANINTSDCWGVDNRFYSWQNDYGYSLQGSTKIPSLMLSNEVDVFGQGLQFAGRVRKNAALCDIRTLKPFQVWGSVDNVQPYHFRPGQDEFTLLAVLNFEGFLGIPPSGPIITVGDAYGLRVVSPGVIRVELGGISSDVGVGSGEVVILVKVGLSSADVYANGELVQEIPVGGVYSSGGDVKLLGDSGDNLAGVTLAFVGVGKPFTQEQVDSWNERCWLDDVLVGGFYFYPANDMVFDISGNGNHVKMTNLQETHWSGKQSRMAYLVRGYTRVFPNKDALIGNIAIPLTLSGRQITHNFYGESQVNVYYKGTGGIPIFDAYVDMNPENKKSGFWADFWNKTSDYWTGLDTVHFTDSPYKWHLSELTMGSLHRVMTSKGYNFAFTGGSVGRYNLTTEIFDLVVLNTGNNIQPKQIIL